MASSAKTASVSRLWPFRLGNYSLLSVIRAEIQPIVLSRGFDCNACRAAASQGVIFTTQGAQNIVQFGLTLCETCGQQAKTDLGNHDGPQLGRHLTALAQMSLLCCEVADLKASNPYSEHPAPCHVCQSVELMWVCPSSLEAFTSSSRVTWPLCCATCILATAGRLRRSLVLREAALFKPQAMQLVLIATPIPPDVIRLIWQQMGRTIDLWEVLCRDVERAGVIHETPGRS